MSERGGERGSGAGIVIPVDGPAGSGKSTLARRIADHFSWDYLETGALYRAVGLRVLETGGDPGDSSEAARAARHLQFACRKEKGVWRNFLDGRDVTDLLREERVSDAASRVSAVREVRDALRGFQRRFGAERGAVLDGRDIGTVVFPEVRLKFYMDSDIEVRIQRRFDEMKRAGKSFDPARLAEELRARDRRDRGRSLAPLLSGKEAENQGYVFIETSNSTIDEVFDVMVEKIREVYGNSLRSIELS